ncbi:MAG: geranylgeranyl reductase family protein [Acidimicrobiia bacterium]
MNAVPDRADVVVVGGGPAGAAAAAHLAGAGHEVVVVEKMRHPRQKTCGDGLTPRSVKALVDLGMADEVARWHPVRGLRAYVAGRCLELDWPDHPVFPRHGAVVTRAELDTAIAERARKEGAVFLEDTEATAPGIEDGIVRGVEVRPKGGTGSRVSAAFVVVADGSLSRFGRALGNARDRRYPLGMAIRGYFDSPRDRDDYIESHIDVRDAAGRSLPGYGWVFPEGDGTVNVGIGLLSTFRGWKGVNTSELMEAFTRVLPAYWEVDPDSGRSIHGGKLQMGMSVRPRIGPNWLAVGDAAGAINPFNGEGIAYALETAALAAEVIGSALGRGSGTELWRYGVELDRRYAAYYRAARGFVRLIGEPTAMRVLSNVGMRSERIMTAVLRIMANLLTPELRDSEERVYALLERLVALGPEP